MIAGLSIVNFKGFAALELPCRALTLLTGLNGSGKSSVLQVLLLLRQSWQQGLLQSQRLALNGDLVQIGTARDALHSYAEVDSIRIGLRLVAGESFEWSFTYDRDADVLAGSAQVSTSPRLLEEAGLFSDAFQYLSAERLGPRAAVGMSDYIVRQRGQIGKDGAYAAHYLSVFGKKSLREDARIHPSVATRDLLSQVEAWLSDISPGAQLKLTPLNALDVVQVQYQFQTGAEVTDAYRATNVGFGLTYVLSVIVAALSASPGTVLLIENPEAHLHPRGQRRVGELIAATAAAGVQVFVETHSDHLLNGVRLFVRRGDCAPDAVALHYFSRVSSPAGMQTQATSPVIDRNGRISNWPPGFFDEWDIAVAELLE